MDSHLPHCEVCLKSLTSGSRCPEHTESSMSPDNPPDLMPCPFCGGEAERITIGDDEPNNAGGDVICCTRCQASSHVEFGRKENLVSIWNTRPSPSPALPSEESVTKEMIEAGLACFNQWWRNGGNDFGPPTEEMLADVFRAMQSVPQVTPVPSEGLSEATVRRAYEHFQHHAEAPCSASAMREAIELAIAAMQATPETGWQGIERLQATARALSSSAFTTYRKGNGQLGTIEGDDGEKCFIVPHDEMIEFRAALADLGKAKPHD